MEKRTLTQRENRKIRKMCLSPKVEQAVREQWATEPAPKTNILGTLFSHLLIPAMVAILGICVFLPNHFITKFEGLVIVLVWLIYIILFPLIVGIIFIVVVGEKMHPFSHSTMSLYWDGNRVNKMYGVLLSIALFIFLAMSGHIATTIFAFIAWLIAKTCGAGIKKEVRDKIAEVEN